MARFIHSIQSSNAAIAADGDEVIDLPVNPLSVILLNISPLNETSTITTFRLVEGLLAALTNIRITHKGAAVVDISGIDQAALIYLYHRMYLWQSGTLETDNFRRSIVLPILFGRKAFMPSECFPETKKGELQMTLTWDIAAGAFDGLRRSIETVELPEATPDFVQKVTTTAQTFAATGQNEVDMPVGNVLRGILCFGTTTFTGAAPVPTLGELQTLKDNQQVGFSATDFETLRGLHGVSGVSYPPDFRHIHSLNAAGAGLEDTLEPEVNTSLDDSYALLNFDPTMDDEYSLETEGAGRVHVRCDAEAADAARFMPIEKVPSGRFLEA